MNARTSEAILNYAAEGEGPPVILIHGLAMSLQDWQGLATELRNQGFSTYRVDMFGHGDSPKPDHPRLYTFKVVYGTIEEWIASLDIETPIFLVGHSMGGYMSLMYALRNPEKVRAMVLIDPLFSLKQLPSFMINTHRLSALGVEMLKVAPQRLVGLALGRGPTSMVDFTAEIRQRVVEDVKRASPHILSIASTLPDLTGELGKIETPCQVVWGDQDELLNPATFPTLVSGLLGAIGHNVPGCGHQPHLGDPERVHRLVVDFLQAHLVPVEERVIVPLAPPPLEKRTRQEKRAALLERAEALIDHILDWDVRAPEATLPQIEETVLDLRQQMGQEIVTLLLSERRPPVDGQQCPQCGGQMSYHEQRQEEIETRLGLVSVNRDYYRCPACGTEKPLEWPA